VVWWALRFASTPLVMPIPFDGNVLGLTVLAAAVTTITFGLAPAVRMSGQRPSSTLGTAGTGGTARPRQSRLRQILVMAQVALSLALLATAWQLVSTVRGEAVAAGTPPDRLLLARFDLRPLGIAGEEAATFYRDLAAGALRLPGIEAVGLARHSAVWSFGQGQAQSAITVWRDGDRAEDGDTVPGGYAGADLFAAVGLRVIAGRGFADADRHLRPEVAIVNETAATRMQGAVVGGTLHIAAAGRPLREALPVRVIGIVEASREPRLESGEPPPARVYLPSPIEPEPALALYLRTRDRATGAAQPLRDLVTRIAPRVPILELGSLEDLNERSYATQLWLARAAGFLGIIGVLLATAGLYGVASYVVEMRTREIAIRMAIGARPQTILAMVLGQSLRVALIGVVIGSGAAVAGSRIIQSEYHGVRDVDAAAFAAAVALFLAAMLVASGIPALRASRVDPIENLKDA